MSVSRPLIAVLLIAGVLGFRLQANAQTTAKVYLHKEGATISVVAPNPLELTVHVDDLTHQGEVGYDMDRDTVADRFESSQGLGAFEFELTFDPTKISVGGAIPGAAIESHERTFQCFQRRDDEESFAFACVSFGAEPSGPQGDLELAKVTFVPIGSGPTSVQFEAALAGPLGDDVDAQVEGSLSIIVRGVPDPAPDLGEDPDGTGNGSNDPTDGPGPVETVLLPGSGTAQAPTLATDGLEATAASIRAEGQATAQPGVELGDAERTPADPESGLRRSEASGGASSGGGGLGVATIAGLTLAALAAAGALGFVVVRRYQRQ